MKEIIKKDLFRYEGRRSKSILIQLKYLLFVPGFTYTYLFRRTQLAKNVLAKVLWKIILRFISYITHIQIPPQTQIGEGFYIGHWGMIIINPNTIIGKNFNVSAGVLIGNAQGKHAGTPIIGDNVSLGMFSVVVGGVKIGNDVLIAPGAFINFDVPDNSIVIGNPGKIILRNESPTKKYIVYPV